MQIQASSEPFLRTRAEPFLRTRAEPFLRTRAEPGKYSRNAIGSGRGSVVGLARFVGEADRAAALLVDQIDIGVVAALLGGAAADLQQHGILA